MKFRAIELIRVDKLLINPISITYDVEIENQYYSEGFQWSIIRTVEDKSMILTAIIDYLEPSRAIFEIKHIGSEYIID